MQDVCPGVRHQAVKAVQLGHSPVAVIRDALTACSEESGHTRCLHVFQRRDIFSTDMLWRDGIRVMSPTSSSIAAACKRPCHTTWRRPTAGER